MIGPLTRWRERACTCTHPRSVHLDLPRAVAECQALRCTCPIWDAAWAARTWERIRRFRTRRTRSHL